MKTSSLAYFIKAFLFITATIPAFSQTLYEVRFKDAENTIYTGLMVYFNENDAFMRVGYTIENKYSVVNVKYKTITGKLQNGTNYYYMQGSEPAFITEKGNDDEYNPDQFVWVWEDGKQPELPFVTDNPDDENSYQSVEYFNQLDIKKVTDRYLQSFFTTNEETYNTLRRMREGSQSQPTATTTTASVGKMILIVAANTAIGDIGKSCEVDQNNMLAEFRDVSRTLGLGFQKYVVNGEEFTKGNLNNTLSSLPVEANDIVIFMYTGHGYRWSDQTVKWPQLDLRFSNYDRPSPDNTFNLEEIGKIIAKKGGRLNIILSDCCNSPINIRQMTNSTFMGSRSNVNPETAKLKRLFLTAKGTLIAAATSPGEYAWSNSVNGGFFTSSFLQALREEISYMKDAQADWKQLIDNTIEHARYKTTASVCNGCTKTQNGFYSINITY
jgi:hypothetical protein